MQICLSESTLFCLTQFPVSSIFPQISGFAFLQGCLEFHCVCDPRALTRWSVDEPRLVLFAAVSSTAVNVNMQVSLWQTGLRPAVV